MSGKRLRDLVWVVLLASVAGTILLVFVAMATHPPSWEGVRDGFEEIRRLFVMCGD